MSLSSMSMLMPSVGIWEYFDFARVGMIKTTQAIDSAINSMKIFQSHNPELVATTTSPHFFGVAIALVSCLLVAPIPEARTIEVLFGYAILNFVYLGSFLMTQSELPVIIEYWLLPNLTYLATCVILTLIRRVFISPLRNFPGPASASISNHWMAKELGAGTFSKTVRDLHRRYGAAVVRTGPNEVSVNDAEAIVKIYSGKYQRGSFYEGGKLRGQAAIRETRSQYHHTIWRRIWDKAFTPGELKHYAAQTENATSKLVNSLKKKSGEEVDCTKAMDEFALDLAAQLTYGEDAGIQDGTGIETHLESIKKYLSWLGYYATLRNISELLSYTRDPAVLTTYCSNSESLLINRQRNHPDSHDITSHLLLEDEESRRKFQVPLQLAANTNLSLLMGTAVGTTLSQTFKTLSKNKKIQEKLHKELESHIKKGGDLSTESIKPLPYLSAIITESLRLHNPFTTGVHAAIGEDGLDMGSYRLPPHTQVYVPTLTLMTDEKYFENAEEYIPERWTEKEEMVKDKRAYVPFGYGIHACAGKQLAINELKLVVARVVAGFEIEGEDDEEVEWKDYGMVRVGEWKGRFKSRK
ncbi:hypothetical protein AOL_s00079g255 [Orbilia oligospora ATCC 24927]|uniref:Uncharacterized protein n=1 Tax=Arthrobotrys oligospora (strain ATCC 24927 / CBS 115.81 / DSM 1491) TaxID=756982 RepID=G1XCT5_ARTOA|nr:hypothetical protein AOL_s00079g255 [Orbilia oligospora ATCC 24927]EGX49034.1 hypothetical protein AOL_s00079g255 [Orbilia oligospora ATCC 24927]